jgi:hypothetical protein
VTEQNLSGAASAAVSKATGATESWWHEISFSGPEDLDPILAAVESAGFSLGQASTWPTRWVAKVEA